MTHRLLGIVAASFCLSACTSGLGPTLQDDYCAKGYIDESAVEASFVSAKLSDGGINAIDIRTVSPGVRQSRSDDEPKTEPWPREVSVGILMGSPVIELQTGKTRAAAFAVPTGPKRPEWLVVVPKASGLIAVGGCVAGRKISILRGINPIIQFLDVNRLHVGGVVRGENSVEGPFGAKLFLVPNTAAYFIVGFDPADLGSTFSLPGGTFSDSECIAPTYCRGVTRSGSFYGRATSTGFVDITFR